MLAILMLASITAVPSRMEKCECEICKNQLPFNIPEELIDSILSNDLVLFAGAGISTENNSIFKETLYEDVKFDLNLDDSEDLSFPELMSRYCSSTVNGRQKLLEKIRRRFDYCFQFHELYRAASNFHRELAPLWMIQDIVTTNWDDYFERNCDAIPIVTPEDFAFYKIKQRKVYKIHGSISNYGSVVATNEDYERCLEELKSGIIGANLKMIIATKTLLFVGYSFRDYDFLEILAFLKAQMKGVLPHIYIVTLDENVGSKLDGFDYTLIRTDGSFFLSKIRKHLENQHILIPEEDFERIYSIEYLRRSAHELVTNELMMKYQSPTLIYCAFYQDGIQHAIDYLTFKSKRGEAYDPHHILSHLHTYEDHLRKDMLRDKNYQEVCYIDGYVQGLRIPLYDEQHFEPKEFPMFYIYGIGPTHDVELFTETVIENKIYH